MVEFHAKRSDGGDGRDDGRRPASVRAHSVCVRALVRIHVKRSRVRGPCSNLHALKSEKVFVEKAALSDLRGFHVTLPLDTP